MKQCFNCGLQVEDNIDICPQCGAMLPVEEAVDNKVDKSDNRPKKDNSRWSFSENSDSDNLKPFNPFGATQKNNNVETPKEKRKEEIHVVEEEISKPIESDFNIEKTEEETTEPQINSDVNNKEEVKPEIKPKRPQPQQPISGKSLLLGMGAPAQSKFSDKEAEKFYDDNDVIVGDAKDAEAIAEKEREREQFLSKPNKFKDALFGKPKEDDESKKKGEVLDVSSKAPKRSVFNSMFSGFADEQEDEEIKAEIAKSKKNTVGEKMSSLLNSGSEGRRKKKNNNDLAEDKEVRPDVIEQRDYNEEDYDNYYEFVMPSDNMKYEKKSSFKVHLIALVLVFVAAIAVGILFSKSAISRVL